MHETPAVSASIMHAYSAGIQGLQTRCGRPLDSLGPAESAIEGSNSNPEWITCPLCRESLRPGFISIEDYSPRSSLVVPQHSITRPRYPFIDVHNHQNASMPQEQLDALVASMDALGLRVMVNLSGGSGPLLAQNAGRLNAAYPNRFVTFANIDFAGLNDPDFATRAARQFEIDAAHGAQGLKIFKSFGIAFKDQKGNRIPVDDPRFDALFEVCAGLRLPVLIHTADPKPFFEPVDRFNERWMELTRMPSRAPAPDTPNWKTLIEEQHRLFARHPRTIFINAHLGWLGNDLGELGRLLDRLPNIYTEFSAAIAELGRQPRHARAWFLRYQDRILFGKDTWNPIEYHTYFRVLETADEYFDHFRKYQAGWKLYGLKLPDCVLRKVYFENALRVLPNIDRHLF